MFRSSFKTLESVVVVELSMVEAWDVSGTPIRQNNKNTIKSWTGICKITIR